MERDQSVRQKVYVFVDFWNFQLGLNRSVNFDKTFKIDWMKLPDVIGEVIQLLLPNDPIFVDEVRVYVSYDPQKDSSLKRWANDWLATRPRYKVTIKERTKRDKPAYCSKCKTEIPKCPKCGTTLRGSFEKGIDTSIVTDLLKLAWEEAYDIAVIISSDADFAPAAVYLGEKGKKIIAAGFPPLGKTLRQSCWAQIDINSKKEELRFLGMPPTHTN